MILEQVFFSVVERSLCVGVILLLLCVFARLWQAHSAPPVRRVLWILLSLCLLIPLPVPALNGAAIIPISNAPIILETAAFALSSQETPQNGGQPEAALLQMREGTAFSITPLHLLLSAWIAGVIVFALYQALAYYAMRRSLLRGAAPPADEQIVRRLDELAGELGLKRSPEILISAQAVPLTMGILRPIIFLPRETYAPEELSLILRHELTHMKQRDVLIKLCLLAANAVHWFNPLVYYMRHEAAADIEAACDSRVLNGSSFAQRRSYGETILSSIEGRKTHGTILTTRFYGGVRTMKRRIQNILEPPNPRRGVWPAAILVLSAVFMGCLIACTTHTPPQWVNGTLDMGSLFDHVAFRKDAIYVRGLSMDMTPQEMCAYYGLAEDAFEIYTYEERKAEEGFAVPANTHYILQNVSFAEISPYPATIQFTFNGEGSTLTRIGISVRYAGIPWETAHAHAMSVFEAVNEKAGDMITDDEWMQRPDYKGLVVNDFADPLESLSELNSSFVRQYMYIGSSNSDGFSFSMSYQDLSETDTTEGLGQNVDELFAFTLNIPIDEAE